MSALLHRQGTSVVGALFPDRGALFPWASSLGSLRWAERSRALVSRKKYEAHLANMGADVEGDEELNSANAFRIRQQLKHNAQVVEVLEDWWDMAQLTARANGRPNATTLILRDYSLIYRVLYLELLGEESYEEEEADTSAVEEFEQEADEADGREMSGTAFKSGMFELCDLHVPSLVAIKYIAFLEGLLTKLPRGADGSLLPAPSMEQVHAARAARQAAAEKMQAKTRERGGGKRRGKDHGSEDGSDDNDMFGMGGAGGSGGGRKGSSSGLDSLGGSGGLGSSGGSGSHADALVGSVDGSGGGAGGEREAFMKGGACELMSDGEFLEARYVDGTVCRAIFLPWAIPNLRGSTQPWTLGHPAWR